MRLIYKFYTRHTEQLDALFKVSNNLWNQALHVFRQRLDNDGIWLLYDDMDKIMKQTLNLNGECNYRLLKAQCSQQVLRTLDKSIKAYCKSIKDWKKHPEKYKAKPRMPSYRKRGGMFSLFYTKQSATIRNGQIRLSKGMLIAIPQWGKYGDKISKFNQIRLIPERDKVKVEIAYDKELVASDVDENKYASIDLGIDNLATMVTSEGCVIWSGKHLKSYNRYFNKKLTRLQSIKDLQGIKRSTKHIIALYDKRDKYFEDVFHKVSRQIVDVLVEKKIGTLVVGYNVGWKQNVNMGRKNNQKFVLLPFARLISYLSYKCKLAGIDFIKHEESYTSKCDALALEEVCKHEDYLGKRVKRGLFRSSVGKIINADQNGALNILRKVVGDSEFVRITGSGHSLCPVRHCNPFKRSVRGIDKVLNK